jgi:hypothetical protein
MRLFDIAGRKNLESAGRLNAAAPYPGALVGPGVGAMIRLAFGLERASAEMPNRR